MSVGLKVFKSTIRLYCINYPSGCSDNNRPNVVYVFRLRFNIMLFFKTYFYQEKKDIFYICDINMGLCLSLHTIGTIIMLSKIVPSLDPKLISMMFK